MAELLCPKCRVAMESLERSGITLERCTECGGVFLDRGELERLELAEQDAAPSATVQTSDATIKPSGQALLGDLMSLARQYRGGGRRL